MSISSLLGANSYGIYQQPEQAVTVGWSNGTPGNVVVTANALRIEYARFGSLVVLSVRQIINSFNLVAAPNNSIITANHVLPLAFRPATLVRVAVNTTNANAADEGILEVATTGVITIGGRSADDAEEATQPLEPFGGGAPSGLGNGGVALATYLAAA